MKSCQAVSFLVFLSAILAGCTDADSQPTPKSGATPILVDEGSSITDIDGNVYGIIQIGEQVWMSENLRATRYRNGEEIPYARTDTAWKNEEVGMRCAYDHDEGNSKAYGQLYNWYAVDDERGLCPSGWHVPSDDEWNNLERSLGLSSVDAKQWGSRGVHGSAMKSEAWDGTNESGFSALPAGLRVSSGDFFNLGDYGKWWSSSPNGGGAISRGLYSGYSSVNRDDSDPRSGFSVRCVRD